MRYREGELRRLGVLKVGHVRGGPEAGGHGEGRDGRGLGGVGEVGMEWGRRVGQRRDSPPPLPPRLLLLPLHCLPPPSRLPLSLRLDSPTQPWIPSPSPWPWPCHLYKRLPLSSLFHFLPSISVQILFFGSFFWRLLATLGAVSRPKLVGGALVKGVGRDAIRRRRLWVPSRRVASAKRRVSRNKATRPNY